eukprot:TRINITY_DN479_c0_g1_i7.p1 TRINITY_DN479_c0_g1~~TRINITY_DN479_c0_g1_i7.p1  ORF type:complete len:282 (+),score=43.59 TRINITY_DN479_c0_g1_i7:83-928(+)
MYSHSFAERVKFPNIEPDIGKCLNFLELCLDIWPSSGVYFTLGIIFKCDVISVGDELSIPHEVAREKAKNYLRLAYQADKTHADAVYHLADLLIQEDRDSAKELFEISALEGHPFAAMKLILLNLDTFSNFTHAQEWAKLLKEMMKEDISEGDSIRYKYNSRLLSSQELDLFQNLGKLDEILLHKQVLLQREFDFETGRRLRSIDAISALKHLHNAAKAGHFGALKDVCSWMRRPNPLLTSSHHPLKYHSVGRILYNETRIQKSKRTYRRGPQIRRWYGRH